MFFRCQTANLFASLRSTPRYYCNVCESDIPRFVHISNALWITRNSACPKCDSRKRHRGLFLLYQRLFPGFHEGFKLLHFAPEPILVPLIKQSQCEYRTTDYFLQDVDFPGEDVQSLSFSSQSFDCVLSNHVIEHVADDFSAFRELARILIPGGAAIITIPGDWKRKETITFPDLSNNGHYRDYGLDVVSLLEKVFASVEVVDLFDEAGRNAERLGLDSRHDLAFVCRV